MTDTEGFLNELENRPHLGCAIMTKQASLSGPLHDLLVTVEHRRPRILKVGALLVFMENPIHATTERCGDGLNQITKGSLEEPVHGVG